MVNFDIYDCSIKLKLEKYIFSYQSFYIDINKETKVKAFVIRISTCEIFEKWQRNRERPEGIQGEKSRKNMTS